MFKAPASHHCDSFRTSQRERRSSSNLQGDGDRGANNALRYEVWADGGKKRTEEREEGKNHKNLPINQPLQEQQLYTSTPLEVRF